MAIITTIIIRAEVTNASLKKIIAMSAILFSLVN